jgi:hypothetical protein
VAFQGRPRCLAFLNLQDIFSIASLKCQLKRLTSSRAAWLGAAARFFPQ